MAVLGFVGTVIFARELGPDGFGVFQTASAVVLLVSQVPTGFGTAIKKRVSEVDTAPQQYLGAGLVIELLFTSLLAFSFYVFSTELVAYLGSSELVVVVAVTAVAIGIFSILNQLLAGVGYPALSSWVDAARSVGTLLLQLVFLYLGLGAVGLVLGLGIATFLSALIPVLYTRLEPKLPSREALSSVYSFGRWSMTSRVLTTAYDKSNVLLLTAIVGSQAAGLYASAYQLGLPAGMFAGSIRDALSVKSSGVSSAGGDIRGDLVNAISYTGLLSVPMFFGALALSQQLMTTIYGPAYSSGGPALIGLLLYWVFNSYRNPFEAALEGVDKPDTIVKINGVILALHIPLAYLLVNFYGILGVIVSFIVADACRFVLYQYVAYTSFGGVILPRPMLEQLFAGAVMFVVLYGLLATVISITSVFWLIGVVGFGATVFFVTLGTISSHFRETGRNILADFASK